MLSYVAATTFSLLPAIGRNAAKLGEVADYMGWLRRNFGRIRPMSSRERLWETIAARIDATTTQGVELGVAFGYSSDWWLRRISAPQLVWDGYDRFTGLPRAWRQFTHKGAFDAGGKPPRIDDSRVTWHVGDVEDQLPGLRLNRGDAGTGRVLVLFDLDIFEPSRVAWDLLKDQLRPGDVLYFDEAFDDDERRLLDEHILPWGSFTLIGASPLALALEVRLVGSADKQAIVSAS